MKKDIIIIGGGIIGLSSAYFLQKEGHQVTVIDQSSMDTGASFVNAGYISPSHIIPLAAPGVMKKGIKWMFNSSSPLYIKPRLDLNFLQWVWAFNKSCSEKNVQKSMPVIRDIALMSEELFDDIKKEKEIKFHYDKKGLLMLCETEKMLDVEREAVRLANELGMEAEEISLNQLKILEPKISLNVKGATIFKCDSHSTPSEFMEGMKSLLVKKGVRLLKNTKVIDFDLENGQLKSLITDKETYHAEEFVMAAGSWSPMLSKKLGLKMLLEAGKGYCIDSFQVNGIVMPAILAEAKVAITPMNGFTRYAGTMEIAGVNNSINSVRVDAIANRVSRVYENVDISEKERSNASAGLRPVTPDGLPYIGKSSKCKNLTFATGHAMLGWTLGPATGKLVAEIIDNRKTSMSVEVFQPERKF